jgi:hypothetical protein
MRQRASAHPALTREDARPQLARSPQGYWALISWVSGTVQTLLYADFVYLFVTKRNAQGHMILPS